MITYRTSQVSEQHFSKQIQTSEYQESPQGIEMFFLKILQKVKIHILLQEKILLCLLHANMLSTDKENMQADTDVQ